MRDGWTRPTTDGWWTANCAHCETFFMLPWATDSDLAVFERQGFLGLAHHRLAEGDRAACHYS